MIQIAAAGLPTDRDPRPDDVAGRGRCGRPGAALSIIIIIISIMIMIIVITMCYWYCYHCYYYYHQYC